MSFADDMAADLVNVFFEDFGEVATYRPAIGSPYSIRVIFDEAFESVSMEGTIPVSSVQPTCKFRQSALLAVQSPKDTWTIRGKNYSIAEPQPDGRGIVINRLTEI